jgi:hypothetical protein
MRRRRGKAKLFGAPVSWRFLILVPKKAKEASGALGRVLRKIQKRQKTAALQNAGAARRSFWSAPSPLALLISGTRRRLSTPT